jgi:hypothetical protein
VDAGPAAAEPAVTRVSAPCGALAVALAACAPGPAPDTPAGILAASGTPHELHVYPGFSHEQAASDAEMLERVRAWYTAHGVLP